MSRAYRSDCWDSVNHLTRYWEVWERRCVKSARGKGRNGNVETKNCPVEFVLHRHDEFFEPLPFGTKTKTSDRRDRGGRKPVNIGRNNPAGLEHDRIPQQKHRPMAKAS